MRSVTFLLMLAICLLSLKCSATAGEEGGDSQHHTAQQQDVGSVATTKEAENPQPLKQKDPSTDPILEPQPQPDAPILPEAHAEHTEHDDPAERDDHDDHDDHKSPKPGDAHLNNPPTAQSQPGHSSADPLNQQTQQHASQSSTSNDKAERQQDTGVNLENRPDTKPASTPDDVTQTEQIGTQEEHTDSHTDHQEPHAPTQTHAVPPSTPSHSTGSSVQQTPQRQPTTTINTGNTLGKDGDSERARTEKNHQDHNAAQGTKLSSTGGKQDLPDTNKIPMITADITPITADKPAIATSAAADGAVHQTSITTENKKPNQMQTSVTSSSQPVNGESISSADTSMNLSSAVKSFDKTDSSIGTSSLFVLAALATLSLVAVAPAS